MAGCNRWMVPPLNLLAKSIKVSGLMPVAGRLPVIAVCLCLAAAALADDRLVRLPPDQQALAREYSAFVTAMDQKYFGRVAELNGAAEDETLLMENEYSDYDIRVVRGPVVN